MDWNPDRILRIFLFVLMIPLFSPAFGEETKIHFIDEGNGDAVLVQGSTGTVLIDAGADRNTTALYLEKEHITEINEFLVTEYTFDKAGGIQEVMNRTHVQMYRDIGAVPDLPLYQRIKNRLINESVPYTPLIPGERIQAGEDGYIEVMPVNSTETVLGNDMVLKISIGNITTLLLNRNPAPEISLKEPVHILRVADHGSRNGYDAGFIQSIHPEIAVISTGGLSGMDTSTIMGLEAIKAQVFRTDEKGSIIITTDGEKYSLGTNLTSPSGGSISLVSVIETRPPG